MRSVFAVAVSMSVLPNVVVSASRRMSGPAQRVEDRHGVVDAGVDVEDHAAEFGIMAVLPLRALLRWLIASAASVDDIGRDVGELVGQALPLQPQADRVGEAEQRAGGRGIERMAAPEHDRDDRDPAAPGASCPRRTR